MGATKTGVVMAPQFRISALLLLAICTVATRLDVHAQAPEASSVHEQTATYLIDGHKFDIPKGLVHVYSRDDATIGLLAMLPDLGPADRACGKKGTCDQWISIVLSTSPVAPLSKQRGGMFVDPTTETKARPIRLD